MNKTVCNYFTLLQYKKEKNNKVYDQYIFLRSTGIQKSGVRLTLNKSHNKSDQVIFQVSVHTYHFNGLNFTRDNGTALIQ